MRSNALNILAAKIALEIELVQPLAYTLSAYIETWARSDGEMRIWDRTGHQDMIERVLLHHYARVISVMSGQVPTRETTIDSVALGPAHAASLQARARNQMLHMVRGMDRDLNAALMALSYNPGAKSAVTLERKSLETKKQALSVEYVGRFKETAKQAWHKLKSRLKAMVNIETEAVAEQYQIEWVKQKHANSRIWKRWQNMGDERVRGNPDGPYANSAFDHWTAQGQEVPVDQPFIISGEKLMMPGDTSLGASLGSTINCRCHAAYFIVGPNGERLDIPLQTPVIPAKRTWHQGDRLGIETPVRPTEAITMTGRTRARVVLGDGRTFATIQQTAPDTLVVRVQGRDIARATFSSGTVTSMTVAQGNTHLDVEGLIRRSVAATSRLRQVNP